jgi:cytochrome c peroxidase
LPPEPGFFSETFAGNGRTCATCHRPEQSFSLSPAFIATLAADDPLFVAETNPQLAALEDATLLRQRGLILLNADDFEHPPVFRALPALFNLAHSGPFGLSGTFDTLEAFIRQAIRQHFPKTMARVEGEDFRLPTSEELAQMVAFLRSLEVPYDRDFTLARFVRTPAQQRGMALFFGEAKCAQCHGGVALSEAAADLGGGDRAFDTGVNTLEVAEPLRSAETSRIFSTPALFGVGHTAPFFHNNQFVTLREAIEFYNSEAFNSSPTAAEVGPIALNTEQINNLVAFLQGLTCPHDGDVNRDGRVTPGDAQRVLQRFLGSEAEPMDTCRQDQGDVASSGDGLTPADAVCLWQEFLGQSSCPRLVDQVSTQVAATSCQGTPGGACSGITGTEGDRPRRTGRQSEWQRRAGNRRDVFPGRHDTPRHPYH